MNWKVLAVGAVVVAPLIWILASGFGHDPRAIPTTTIGSAAADFSLVSLDGERVKLSALRGQPVVLNFWSTWCGPCVHEHPLLQAAAEQREDIAFLGVLYGDDADKARAYLQRAGSAYPTLVDDSQRVVVDYGVAGVPETFFIDSQGTIVHKVSGGISQGALMAALENLE
jgi:cytochrome c biogenesis protein CcmG, thiol:disulfide interchange protein DsbE